MEAFVADWLNLLLRWLHFIAGTAWIGASFYFIWLDNHLRAPERPREGADLAGEVWSVHGGGFYRSEKYRVAPMVLPDPLYWFKWEAYTTWLSGMALLALVYWYGAGIYLVDPSVARLSPVTAVLLSAGFIAGGWLVYDLLCRTPAGRHERAFGVLLLLAASLLAWGLCQLFSGRAAYLHFGAVLGTIMVANVYFVIIPGQRQMVAAASRGEVPDPAPGIRAKQRSVHNTYFTLPVLFTMLSNHYALTYAHEFNWLVLIAIALAGALIRVYFVRRHSGRASLLPLAIAVALLVAAAAAIAPRAGLASGAPAAQFVAVREVIHERCSGCHSAAPTHPAFPAPPAGVVLDTDSEILAEAARIHQQTVVTRVMPIGNLTNISNEERELIDRWYRGGARGTTP